MKTSLAATLPLWPEDSERSVAKEERSGPCLEVVHLYRSEGHNYFGHYQRPPGDSPTIEETRLQLVSGKGIVGDRFYHFKRGYRGQVTFFAIETWERLQRELGHEERTPAVFRRNVVTRGIDLLSLVGTEFEVQGVRFLGTEHCKPCAWMDLAFAPSTLARLAEWRAGGLRAEVLSSGWLAVSKKEDAACLAQ